jgi:hypothetical protein
MLFNSYDDILGYCEKTYPNIRFSLSGYILSLRNQDNDLIVNYDLRFTNFILLDGDINHLHAKCMMDLNYKF